MTNVNGTLFFLADDYELWKSDGTTAGTVKVADINLGSNNNNFTFDAGLKNVNGTLFFQAEDSTHSEELWKSDGTAAGTLMVAISISESAIRISAI